jgi:hypothetical protein
MVYNQEETEFPYGAFSRAHPCVALESTANGLAQIVHVCIPTRPKRVCADMHGTADEFGLQAECGDDPNALLKENEKSESTVSVALSRKNTISKPLRFRIGQLAPNSRAGVIVR